MPNDESIRAGMSEDEPYAQRESCSLEQVLETQGAPELQEELTGVRDAWHQITVDEDARVPAAAMPSPLRTRGAAFVSRRRAPEDLDESLGAPALDDWATDEFPAADVSSQLPALDPEVATSAHTAMFTPPPVSRRPAVSTHFESFLDEQPPSSSINLVVVPERRAKSLDIQGLAEAELDTSIHVRRTQRKSAPTNRTIHEGDALEETPTGAGSSEAEASEEAGVEQRRSSLPLPQLSLRRTRGISFNLGHSLYEAIRRTKSTELPPAVPGVSHEGEGTSPPDAAASAEVSIPQTILRFASKWRTASLSKSEAPESASPEGSLRVGTNWRRKNVVRRVSTVIDPNLEAEYIRNGSVITQKLTSSQYNLEALMGRHADSTNATTVERGSVFDNVKQLETAQWKQRLEAYMDGVACSTFVFLVTLWALFGDDLRLVCTPKEADEYFVILAILCLIVFSIELVLSCICKQKYLFHFYFWLDLIATLSLFLDIPETYEILTGIAEQDSTQDLTDDRRGGARGSMGNSAALARAGRISRAGTRAGRIARLIRLARILKVYKAAMLSILSEAGYQEEEVVETRESLVGKKLSDITTQRVIVGVLLMMFGLQLFELETYRIFDYTTLMNGGLHVLVATYVNRTDMEQVYRVMDAYRNNSRGLYWIKVNGSDVLNNQTRYPELLGPEYRSLRNVEVEQAVVLGDPALGMEISFAKFDIRRQSILQAQLNIGQTLFICFILGLGAMLFSRDANQLVLMPLEKIFEKMSRFAAAPLDVAWIRTDTEAGDDPGGFEMQLINDTFLKLTSLMVVGFGEAGVEIIAENMASGTGLDPMVPGKKVVAIFGFCDIRLFNDITEVLQVQVMEFVNTIAKIVHMEVHLHDGSANKNIGNAFLLVWKFPPEVQIRDIFEALVAGAPAGNRAASVSAVADKALATFVIIQSMLRRSGKLREYQHNTALSERLPDYEVQMGFGLHVGWAIQGAIGSEYKVDASYLSPNINLASRLEAATLQFGTSILFSGDFLSLLSPTVASRCRAIDRVTVKGSQAPMLLVTYDTQLSDLEFDRFDSVYNKDPTMFTSSNQNYNDEFEEHPDIIGVSARDEEFLNLFSNGFQQYIEGDWKKAKNIFRSCEMRRKTKSGQLIVDGPSQTLLRVMEKHGFLAPDNWEGYRELTDK